MLVQGTAYQHLMPSRSIEKHDRSPPAHAENRGYMFMVGNRKRRKIFNYIKKHTSGKAIVFLQETHSVQKVEKLFEYQIGEVKCFSVTVLPVVEGSAFASGMTLITKLLKSLMIKTVGILLQEWRYRASLTF